jgi:hypothetical protein
MEQFVFVPSEHFIGSPNKYGIFLRSVGTFDFINNYWQKHIQITYTISHTSQWDDVSHDAFFFYR